MSLEMPEYHKIQTIYKRDQKGNRHLLEGEWTCPEFEYLRDNIWEYTEKVDGTNIRVYWDGKDKIKFGGKTDRAVIPQFLLDKLNEIFTIEKFKQAFPDDPEGVEKNNEFGGILLYGEGFGKKIQKVGANYIPDGVDFILFDAKIGKWWLTRETIDEIGKKLEIKVVPSMGQGSLENLITLVKQGIPSLLADNLEAEGIVARPQNGLLNRAGRRIITKLKHVDFT